MAQNVSQNIDSWKSKLDKILHEKNAFTDILEKIEKKINVRRLYLVLGFAVFLALYLMIGYGAQFLCNFLGFLYPAYASIKAIESREKDDDTKWLTYWVVYSVFSLIEFFTDIFLFWIPFYWFLKCIFLVYCMAPMSWNGSLTIYFRLIRPFFLKHQKKVDEALDSAAEAAQGVINEVFRKLRFRRMSEYRMLEGRSRTSLHDLCSSPQYPIPERSPSTCNANGTCMEENSPSPGASPRHGVRHRTMKDPCPRSDLLDSSEGVAKDAAADAAKRNFADFAKTD